MLFFCVAQSGAQCYKGYVVFSQSLLRLCGRNIWMHPTLLTNIRVRRGERRLVVLVGRRRGLSHAARWVHETHLRWGRWRWLGGKIGESRPEGDSPDEEGDVDVKVEGHRAGVHLELQIAGFFTCYDTI